MLLGQKEKVEFLLKVEKYSTHKAGDKESPVWASSNPVDRFGTGAEGSRFSVFYGLGATAVPS
jgi:hypothetical protein